MEKIKAIITWFLKDRKRLVIPAVVVLAISLWLIFFRGKTQQTQIQTQKVEQGTIISSVSASGQVLIANIVNITTSANGLVKNVYVKDGDKVTAGQKILEITLDSDAQQKAASAWSGYLSAKNSLESTKASQYSLQSEMFAKWKTFKDLAESSSYDTSEERDLPQFRIAENDWLAAEAKYKNQQNVISQAQAAVSNSWTAYQVASPIVTTPMAGTVTNITYSEGMTITGTSNNTQVSGQRIAVIKSEGTPLATFNISEIDVSKVKPGQKATIKLDSITDKTFTGKVVSVDRIGTVTSGVTNYPVVIRFDTETPEVLPNMAATANIILETKDNVLLIPSSAIQTQGTQNVVRVMKGKKEQTVTVETGLTSDTQTEILSGLSEDDEVVISTITPSSQQGGTSVFGGGGAGRMFMGR